MTRTIDFPHLGIHLSSVGNHITVFGFDIAYYGMIIGAGILAGIFMAVIFLTITFVFYYYEKIFHFFCKILSNYI